MDGEQRRTDQIGANCAIYMSEGDSHDPLHDLTMTPESSARFKAG